MKKLECGLLLEIREVDKFPIEHGKSVLNQDTVIDENDLTKGRKFVVYILKGSNIDDPEIERQFECVEDYFDDNDIFTIENEIKDFLDKK